MLAQVKDLGLMPDPQLLEVERLTAGFGNTPVLFDVDMLVRPGELVALIGANGAGKSSLLGALTGLVQVSSGTVRFDGRRVTGWRPEAIVGVGLVHVPQGRRLFGTMTVERNLQLGAYRRRDGKVQEDMRRVLEYFPALSDKLQREAGTLSGGEQQMCAMGRALMAKPKLLMLDEPSLGLSPILVETIFSIIGEINSTGTPVLLVEQNARKALEVAHRGYVIETGVIVQTGTGKELLSSEEVQKAYLGM